MQPTKNIILLTGGTSGIGFELLRQFYQLDIKKIVVSRDPAKLEKLQEEFPEISIIVCDLGDPSSVRNLIDESKQKYPDINILINNTGVQYNYNWIKKGLFWGFTLWLLYWVFQEWFVYHTLLNELLLLNLLELFILLIGSLAEGIIISWFFRKDLKIN
jgi:NAD(P)-dependent dehydrogenase (short-subunit alcohol dehydrogenase family)